MKRYLRLTCALAPIAALVSHAIACLGCGCSCEFLCEGARHVLCVAVGCFAAVVMPIAP